MDIHSEELRKKRAKMSFELFQLMDKSHPTEADKKRMAELHRHFSQFSPAAMAKKRDFEAKPRQPAPPGVKTWRSTPK